MFFLKRGNNIIERVREIAEPLCASEGMELVHIEYRRESSGVILRLFIDRPGGVTLDDCTDISRQLDDLLDIHIEEIPPYTLEVSSPGIDRPLVKKEDYEKFKGQKARIKTVKPMNGQKNFKGILQGISRGNIKLEVDGKTVTIPLNDILKGNLAVNAIP